MDASASAVVSHAFQLTRMIERSGVIPRLYDAAELPSGCAPALLAAVHQIEGGWYPNCWAVRRRRSMDNELDPNRTNEPVETNEEEITGRADDAEEFEDTEDDEDADDVDVDADEAGSED